MKNTALNSLTAELCKCLTKTQEWQHHKEYCPIWKNGKIRELKQALKGYVSDHESYDGDMPKGVQAYHNGEFKILIGED